ncbi:MAG: response regulator transcription factor [Deltaproteobacteria bacterium]|nr:response regulator transcription factor [Deltaproteobacteria bacterium]
MRILLVEDDRTLGVAIAEELRETSYTVDLVVDGSSAAKMMSCTQYDGVVLDDQIPSPTGLELLRSWRAEGRETPVLMVTARGSLEERVVGLDAGADDYLAKPFKFSELMARVRSLLRRGERPMYSPLRSGVLSMNRPLREVRVSGELIQLSGKEFALLEYLLARRGEVISRGELIEHAWDSTFDSLTNVVDVLIHRLRQKIQRYSDHKLIETVKGVGYRLVSEEP